MKSRSEKVFYIISIITFCIFGAMMFLVSKTFPRENFTEYMCMMVLILVSFVLTNTLNICLYSARKKMEEQ